jgi:hypothetical protein
VFSVCYSNNYCSAGCASSASVDFRDMDLSRSENVSLNRIA